MSEDKSKISRRDFFKGAAMGVLGGAALGMGLFSYSPWGKSYFPEVKRKLADIGTCKSRQGDQHFRDELVRKRGSHGRHQGRRRAARQPVQLQLAAFRRRHRPGQGKLREGHRQDQTPAAEQPGGGLGNHRKTLGQPTERGRVRRPGRDRGTGRPQAQVPARQRLVLQVDGRELQARGHRPDA